MFKVNGRDRRPRIKPAVERQKFEIYRSQGILESFCQDIQTVSQSDRE
jgi:hypothetical protein